jgi:hypothetical protein
MKHLKKKPMQASCNDQRNKQTNKENQGTQKKKRMKFPMKV